MLVTLLCLKNAMSTLVGGMIPHGHHQHHGSGNVHHQNCHQDGLPPLFPYGRPEFLDLTSELLQYSTEHASRPVLTLKRDSRLPWRTGYAETINAGKSMLNEDQASCELLYMNDKKQSNSTLLDDNGDGTGIPLQYWGMFDGHAGSGCAIMASKLLHRLIRDRLEDIAHLLENPSAALPICLANNGSPYQGAVKKGANATQDPEKPDAISDPSIRFHMEKAVSLESLIMGVIENAFKQMDELIEKEKMSYTISGGCCALAAIHLMGKLYVANAGDSRAIIIRNGEVIPMSNEFTPESERQRLQYLGFLRPELLGNEFTPMEFPRRIQYRELGRKMLFRDHTMNGWAYKTIVEDDLKFPLIYGEGKKVKLDWMGHIQKLTKHRDTYNNILGTQNYEPSLLLALPNAHFPSYFVNSPDAQGGGARETDLRQRMAGCLVMEGCESYYYSCYQLKRYTLAAQDLLMRSRGVLKERGWRLPNERLGSGDDITCYVIPLAGPAGPAGPEGPETETET
ncbi:unnamed protein product [Oncorhynchus mykiss]|uniref:PPM-type phosphatase domain-containing protein n=1 Tax=Oncorhynchus mykiss TaxID=8022 RepID=A0A060XTY6_ONCMY|nr:unnamed protein product [Oncorhynchus mykiss]